MTPPQTHLDLCTGIGGFHLAAQWAGFQTVGFAEIDPYCCLLLAEKWPHIKNYGDLRRADFDELRGRIDVLSAGVPCQPASLAGKRRGARDDRWLWPTVLDVVERVKPAWCIFENPVGILTLDEFGGVLLCLGEAGYALRAFSVPANAVGAKHLRYRVFIVAHAQPERCDRWPDEWQPEAGAGTSVEPSGAGGDAEALADAARSGWNRRGQPDPARSESNRRQGESAGRSEVVADAASSGWQEQCGTEPIGSQQPVAQRHNWRLTEPPLCGRTDGLPNRSHRLKALGNSVCPQQAYPFFQAIATQI
jgi:DNA (cytosine-5)-methyltransferase 1